MKIVLLSCASKILNEKSKAQDLYMSPLFKYNLIYAKSLNPNKIFILDELNLLKSKPKPKDSKKTKPRY